jgi:hypothetical protein
VHGESIKTHSINRSRIDISSQTRIQNWSYLEQAFYAMTGISASHPYYPLGANIIDYSPNQASLIELLVTAGGRCAALLGLTFTVASYVRPTLHMADRIAILWFVLCMTSPHP